MLPSNAAVHILVFATVLALLSTTIQQGIPGGDSGELVAEGCLNGVAHPPGYPLYISLVRSILYLFPFPTYTPALVSNLLSAVFASLAAVHISLCVDTLMRHYHFPPLSIAVGCVVASVGFATSQLQWLYSIGSEVFALNNCLCTCVVYLYIRYMCASHAATRRSSMVQGSFMAGLCLSNQHTSILFLLVIILAIVVDSVSKQEFTPFLFLQLILAGMLGLSPYVLLYRSTTTLGSWGDTSTLGGLWVHVLRREYGTFSLSPTDFQAEGWMERTMAYLADTRQDLGLSGYFLAVGGVCLTLLHRPLTVTKDTHTVVQRIVLVVCCMWCFYLAVFHYLSNLPLDNPMAYEVHRRFWMQPNIVISIFLGLGTCHAVQKWTQVFKPLPSTSNLHRVLGYCLAGILPLYLLGWTSHSMELYSKMSSMNSNQGRYFQRFGRESLKAVESNQKSLLISSTDINWNSIRYLQSCEGVSLPSVVHVSLQIYPFPWFSRQQHLYDSDVVWPPVLDDASMTKNSVGKRVAVFFFFIGWE